MTQLMPTATDELTEAEKYELARTMVTKVVLTFPLPPKELNPNARLHYFPKAEETKGYRAVIQCLAVLATRWKAYKDTRYRLTETYRIAGKRKRDVRNLFAAFKAGEDGLVDAGILPGDDDSVLEHGAPKIERVASKKDEGVLVMIEELAL